MIYHIVQGNYDYGYFKGDLEHIKDYIAISTSIHAGKLVSKEIYVKEIDMDSVCGLKQAKEIFQRVEKEYEELKIEGKRIPDIK